MTLHVESTGHGPPLVLLHGWAMHSGVWGPLIPYLAKRWLAAALPNACLALIAGAAHAPFLSRPDVFDRVLTHFLDGC